MNSTEVSVKTCSRCKRVWNTTNFYKDKARPDGFTPQCKDCMKAHAKARRERGQERVVQREWRKLQRANPNGRYRAGRLLQEAKKRAEVTITLDWLADKISTGVCEVTGLPFDLTGHGYPPNCFAPSIDRVDPAKGYTPENVKVVVWVYNRAKGPNTHEDVVYFCKALVAYNDNQPK
jgi:hypothetical protein